MRRVVEHDHTVSIMPANIYSIILFLKWNIVCRYGILGFGRRGRRYQAALGFRFFIFVFVRLFILILAAAEAEHVGQAAYLATIHKSDAGLRNLAFEDALVAGVPEYADVGGVCIVEVVLYGNIRDDVARQVFVRIRISGVVAADGYAETLVKQRLGDVVRVLSGLRSSGTRGAVIRIDAET